MAEIPDELVEMLKDLAEGGLRFDLTPTHKMGDEEFWHRYIRDMDAAARSRGRRGLRLIEKADQW